MMREELRLCQLQFKEEMMATFRKHEERTQTFVDTVMLRTEPLLQYIKLSLPESRSDDSECGALLSSVSQQELPMQPCSIQPPSHTGFDLQTDSNELKSHTSSDLQPKPTLSSPIQSDSQIDLGLEISSQVPKDSSPVEMNSSFSSPEDESSDYCQLVLPHSLQIPSLQTSPILSSTQTVVEMETSSQVFTESPSECETEFRTLFQIVKNQDAFQSHKTHPENASRSAGRNVYTRRQWSNPDWGPCMQSFVVDPRNLRFYLFLMGRFWRFKI